MIKIIQSVFFFLLTICFYSSYSQQLVTGEGVTHFYGIDNSKLMIATADIKSIGNVKYIVTVDSTNTDTIDFAYTPVSMFDKRDDEIFLVKRLENDKPFLCELYKVSLLSGEKKLLTKSKINFSGRIKDTFYGTKTLDYDTITEQLNEYLPEGSEAGISLNSMKTKLVGFDSKTKEEKTVFAIRDFYEDYLGEIYQLYFSPLNGNILIVIGDTEEGAFYYNSHYFLYNAIKDSVSKITLTDLSEDEIEYGINYGDIYPDFSTGQHLLSTKGILLNSDFQKIGRTLKRSQGTVKGYNYIEDSVISMNLSSRLDTSLGTSRDRYQRVIVDFSFYYALEKTLYAVYHNQALTYSDLESLSKQQLQLAKNMIFARHNYQFESPYYQAFFNLFDFYNTEEMRKSRAQTMEGKLSRNDVQNSRLINQTIRTRN